MVRRLMLRHVMVHHRMVRHLRTGVPPGPARGARLELQVRARAVRDRDELPRGEEGHEVHARAGPAPHLGCRSPSRPVGEKG